MNERTRSYLQGRFGDYYRRNEPTVTDDRDGVRLPPDATSREWAYIPFSSGEGTRMIRHEAIIDDSYLGEFLERGKPRHVYHSTATYDDPGSNTMGTKGWRGADLVFDLDADHLPDVDPDRDDTATMLAACRDATVELVDQLTHDFGFSDLTVVFSGNRGYHVHVRDPGVDQLDRHARREVVEYVRGEGIAYESIVTTEAIAGGGTKRRFHVDRGWGRRFHQTMLAYLEPLRERSRAEIVNEIATFPGMGPSRAESVARTIESRWSAIERGELDLHPDFIRFVRIFVEHRVSGTGPAIDEPVTTDVHRLIRLPGSLHGATGLVVKELDIDALASFEPLAEATAPMFEQVDIAIEISQSLETTVGGTKRQFDPGHHVVPEFLGIYLMARGQAEKVQE